MSRSSKLLEGPTLAEVLSGTARELERSNLDRLRLMVVIGNLALSAPDDTFFYQVHWEVDRVMAERSKLQRSVPC